MANITADTDDPRTSCGKLLPEWAFRGLLDVPVEPGVANVTLYPGQHVGLLDDMTFSHTAVEKVGIVDPFLSGPVNPGERFWVWYYPETVHKTWNVMKRKPKAFTVDVNPEPPKPSTTRRPVAKPTKSP